MRKAGIPTSQQPESQVRPRAAPGERQYVYEVPKSGGGTDTKVVTHNAADEKHPLPHWEGAPAKDPPRADPLGRLKYTNEKSKVPYNPEP
jgi:hypothetical protein